MGFGCSMVSGGLSEVWTSLLVGDSLAFPITPCLHKQLWYREGWEAAMVLVLPAFRIFDQFIL